MSQVLDEVHTLEVTVNFLPMQCVFLARVFEQAHADALARRRQVRRQELQQTGRFVGRLMVTVFGVEGLESNEMPTPQGFQHLATVCHVDVGSLMQQTTRCSAASLYWDQEMEFEITQPCTPVIIKVSRILEEKEPRADSDPRTPAEEDAPPRARLAQRSGSGARGEEHIMTVPLATVCVYLEDLESCKPFKRWLPLLPIPEHKCADAGAGAGGGGVDPSDVGVGAGQGEASLARQPSASAGGSLARDSIRAHLSADQRSRAREAWAQGAADSFKGLPGRGLDRTQGSQIQVKMSYQYNEAYMAHAVADVASDFRICVLGAGGYVGRRILVALVEAGYWPTKRLVACTRTLDKVRDLSARGVVCTSDVREAMAGCRILVLACRGHHLINQVSCCR